MSDGHLIGVLQVFDLVGGNGVCHLSKLGQFSQVLRYDASTQDVSVVGRGRLFSHVLGNGGAFLFFFPVGRARVRERDLCLRLYLEAFFV